MFSTREIAVAIWSGAFLAFALSQSGVRELLPDLVKAFFRWRILVFIAFLVLCAAGLVWLLHLAGFWTVSLLKDTILWLFPSMGLAVSVVSSHRDKEVFRRILFDSLRIILILEFLVNTYTFSLPIELLLVPFATLIAMLDTVARADAEYSLVARFTTGIQVAIGFAILAIAIVKAAADSASLLSIDSIRQVLLEPVLSALFAPAIYFLLLCARYEDLFLQLRIGPKKDRAVKRYARWQLFRHLGINVHRVSAFMRIHATDLRRLNSRDDVDGLLATSRTSLVL